MEKSGEHPLRFVVSPIIYDGFSTILGGCLGFQPSTVAKIHGKIFAKRSRAAILKKAMDFLLWTIFLPQKKHILLSIESWLFNRDPYKWFIIISI